MCLQCHEHLCDDTIYDQMANVYSDSFDNSEFTLINSISVNNCNRIKWYKGSRYKYKSNR